jgi:hypothetical protein
MDLGFHIGDFTWNGDEGAGFATGQPFDDQLVDDLVAVLAAR